MRLLTLSSILVAADAGETSTAALRTAARLAALAGAKLHVLHVAEDPGAIDEIRLRHHLRATVGDTPELESLRVVPGSAAVVIVEHAAGVGADTIVLGPHRRSVAGGEMGSTAWSVVRTARCPCLVAATELRLPLERVVAPIDLSEAAGGALSVALSWATALRPRGGRARVDALYVTSAPAPASGGEVHEQVLRAHERAGGVADVEIGETIATGPDPVAGIVRAAGSERADLLVMGTRGATLGRSGLGSVSAAVARVTPCPLLLVPPAAWQEHGAG